MQTSPSIAAISAALVKAQAAMKPATMDRVNPHFRNKYATLNAIMDACREPLASNGIAIIQGVEADGATVRVTTTLLHTSGENIASTLTMTATQNTPQGVGSAITYGRRYGLAALVGIVADDDDDAETASEKPKNGNHRATEPPKVTPATGQQPAASRSIEERKRDVILFLKGHGFSDSDIKKWVTEVLGHFPSKNEEDVGRMESAITIMQAQDNSEKRDDIPF